MLPDRSYVHIPPRQSRIGRTTGPVAESRSASPPGLKPCGVRRATARFCHDMREMRRQSDDEICAYIIASIVMMLGSAPRSQCTPSRPCATTMRHFSAPLCPLLLMLAHDLHLHVPPRLPSRPCTSVVRPDIICTHIFKTGWRAGVTRTRDCGQRHEEEGRGTGEHRA
jgi:hypothetical protein